MEKTPLFKNLRLMDSRIKDNKRKGLEAAGVEVPTLEQAEELTRALIARNTYESVSMEWIWNKDYILYIVHTFWNNEKEKSADASMYNLKPLEGWTFNDNRKDWKYENF